jgi:glycosyltransferase involved in cell wall biosynthesis
VTALAGLRVAYLAFDPFPNRKGSGTRISELATGLARAGAEVTVVTLPPSADEAPGDGVRVAPVRVLESNYLSRAIAFRDSVARSLVALRPDVVHFRGPFEGQAALSYAANRGARTLFEVNGLPSVELRFHHPRVARAPEFEARLAETERRLLVAADAIVTQSEATARFLRIRGAPAEKCFVIPNGAHLHARAEREPSAGPLRVLYAGTLAPWQGVADLVVALRRAARDADVSLSIVGFGQKRWTRELWRRARRLRVLERMEIVPAVPREELAERIAAADICVAPLRRDRRNRLQGSSPIKIFEYMAAGRAVLATKLPCLEEILADGHTGLLARPSHGGDLGSRLSDLARDDKLRQRLGRAAESEIRARGTWQHRRDALVSHYERVFSTRR